MTIQEALIQLDALAADLPADYEQELDDLAAAEFILGQVEPRLHGAAFSHLMGRVPRKRAAAGFVSFLKPAAPSAPVAADPVPARGREDYTFDLDADLGY